MFFVNPTGIPRLAPHQIVMRLRPGAVTPRDALALPRMASLGKWNEALEELPNRHVMNALRSLGLSFQVARTYDIGGNEIEEISRLPGLANMPNASVSVASYDPLGLARTFTVHFEHDRDQEEAEQLIRELAGRLRQQTRRLNGFPLSLVDTSHIPQMTQNM